MGSNRRNGHATAADAGRATLRFLGAAGTVTGSKHLVRFAGREVLLDCGLFQGLKELRLRNWDGLGLEARALDAVVLSHGHLDHSGYLPLLVKKGFGGAIHCTSGTRDLVGVVLRDAGYLQEEDAARANRYAYSKHHPALPLYTVADAERTLPQLTTHAYGEPFDVVPGVRALFRRAGHILGSATVELQLGDAPLRLVYSGDLGRWNRPILRDPELVPRADVLILESTYGDRCHAQNASAELARILGEATERGGAVIVPSFAIGRTQELLWTLRTLEEAGRIPSLPVFLDSPMASAVTEIYGKHPEDHDLDMTALLDASREGREAAAHARSPLEPRQFREVGTPDESKALNDLKGPFIIIAGSGMATGGRVLHHLEQRLPDPRTTVLLVGYQAIGTRGRTLQEGAKELRMHGAQVPVRAHIETLDGLSAHADHDELLRWLAGFERPPADTYVVHGEPDQAAALAASIRTRLGWRATVAEDGMTVELPG